jgi:GDP-4-dehydro-6-deoxy-D-mannose reductase
MKKVLVTGSRGFAGRHTCRLLTTSGYEVIGLTRVTNLDDVDPWITETVDLMDSKAMHKIVDKYRPDFIIHLAAQTKNWFTDQEGLFKTNLNGTMNLYNQMVRIAQDDMYKPKILYVSSSEIYGNTDTPHSIDEGAVLRPTNLYAASKASADLVSYSYATSMGLNVVIARPFTHTGPHQSEGFFVSDMASQIIKIEQSESRKGIVKVGNLNSMRDYTDVRDIARAYQAILELDTNPGDIFNICSGKGVVVGDILAMLIKLSPANIDIEIDSSRYRPADIPTFVGNNHRLTEATGWATKYTLERTLHDTLESFRSKVF